MKRSPSPRQALQPAVAHPVPDGEDDLVQALEACQVLLGQRGKRHRQRHLHLALRLHTSPRPVVPQHPGPSHLDPLSWLFASSCRGPGRACSDAATPRETQPGHRTAQHEQDFTLWHSLARAMTMLNPRPRCTCPDAGPSSRSLPQRQPRPAAQASGRASCSAWSSQVTNGPRCRGVPGPLQAGSAVSRAAALQDAEGCPSLAQRLGAGLAAAATVLATTLAVPQVSQRWAGTSAPLQPRGTPCASRAGVRLAAQAERCTQLVPEAQAGLTAGESVKNPRALLRYALPIQNKEIRDIQARSAPCPEAGRSMARRLVS